MELEDCTTEYQIRCQDPRDKADKCAETLLYYGKALPKLSRIENVVISNALEQH